MLWFSMKVKPGLCVVVCPKVDPRARNVAQKPGHYALHEPSWSLCHHYFRYQLAVLYDSVSFDLGTGSKDIEWVVNYVRHSSCDAPSQEGQRLFCHSATQLRLHELVDRKQSDPERKCADERLRHPFEKAAYTLLSEGLSADLPGSLSNLVLDSHLAVIRKLGLTITVSSGWPTTDPTIETSVDEQT